MEHYGTERKWKDTKTGDQDAKTKIVCLMDEIALTEATDTLFAQVHHNEWTFKMTIDTCTKCGKNPAAGKDKSLCYHCRDALDRKVAGGLGITVTELNAPWEC